MKEIGGSGGEKRSESEREKTKMRERQRRAITSNMLHGLRKHGSYRLSPRADINEVLRELAKEAGWIVEPDGTTYRSNSKVLNGCPLCGANANANCKISSEGGKWSTLPVGGGDNNNNSSLLCFDKQPISVTECSASANAMLMVDPPAVMTTYEEEEEEEEEGEALLHSEGEAANIMSNHLINTALLGPLPLLLPLPHF